ncbi:MAG TPA: DUF4239 domain-containing protein [Spirochaetota bacterium]|nr:DUF4239 domain-containing protein [Spirochaetota bacterium]HPO44734.1 DUF4239 domain-containing protein [Spirochaetota bacterium]
MAIFNYSCFIITATLFLFGGMLLISFLSHRVGMKEGENAGQHGEASGAIVSAVFALMGLLVAFTFSGAHSRFDERQRLIVQEANAIKAAYAQLDMLPLSAQTRLREKFKAYALSRASYYDKLADPAAIKEELARVDALQKEIWDDVLAATEEPRYQQVRRLIVPALKEMNGIVLVRSTAIRTHPPALIWIMLFVLGFACAGLTGYRSGILRIPWRFYHALLAGITSAVLYVILDIEYPRFGLIRLEEVNRILVELAKAMR